MAIEPGLLSVILTSASMLGAAAQPAISVHTSEQAQIKMTSHRTMDDLIAASKPSDWRPLDPQHTLYMELPTGRVVIELAPAFAPNHARNIQALVREGYFDGLAILRSQDNYVTQWGDPNDDDAVDKSKRRELRTAKRTLPAEFTVALSKDIPFTRLPDADGYAPEVGFSNGFPSARDQKAGRAWLCHCYGMVGVARGNDADSGGGTSLYAVIGNAPRQLDRNITVVGRVVHGMELLSTQPRGAGRIGFYDKSQSRMEIESVRIAADVPEAQRSNLEVLRTDTETFKAVIESRRNRQDAWYKVPAGHIDLCNVPLIVRPIAKK